MGTHRIPSSDGGESISVAARVRSGRNVVEACEAALVQQGVEEAERRLALRESVVIKQRDNARYDLCNGSQLGVQVWTNPER